MHDALVQRRVDPWTSNDRKYIIRLMGRCPRLSTRGSGPSFNHAESHSRSAQYVTLCERAHASVVNDYIPCAITQSATASAMLRAAVMSNW